ncbi:MAG: LamG-like jellyroll fold domain-containing protein [Nanoarchaeota archaeon]|nr:LamG-like jellyroll fold domain-containing protein [Nanoarchaeota archaeon]
MKKNIMILCMIIVLIAAVCHAGTFVDDTEAEFNLGIYNLSGWRTSNIMLWGELPDSGVNSAVDTTGLVGLWHLNGDANDTSGNGNEGVIYGAIEVDGKLDTAMSFDGVDDWVDCGNDESLKPQSITFLAWVKINGWSSSVPYHEPIVKHGDGCNSNGFGLAVNHRGTFNKHLYLISFSDGINPGDFVTSETLESETWELVGFIWEPLSSTTSRQKLILNGDVVITRDISIPVPSNIASNLLIGKGIDCWETITFNGSIDEVAIYNRSLSSDEIQTMYNAQKDNYPSSGDYESKVHDAGSSATWDNLTWVASKAGALPDNQGVESGEYGANMTGNVLLLHMDEASGTIVDSSGSGNNGAFDFGDYETADLGTNGTIVYETSTYALNYGSDYYNGWIFEATSGPAAGSTSIISDYVVFNIQNDKEIHLETPLTGLASGHTYHIYKNTEGPNSVSGKYGSAIQFDGIDDYIQLGWDAPSLSEISGDKLTIEAWIRPAKVTGYQFIIIKNGPFYLKLIENKLSAWVYTGSWHELIGGIPITVNQWHHVAVVYNSSNISLFVNGIFDKSTILSGNLTGNGQVQIGRYNNGGSSGNPSEYFQGTIDELAIYNRSLSSEEILNHYKRGALRLNISAKSCDDPDCNGETTWDKTCTTSPCDISSLTNSRYIQYKVNLQSDSTLTPELSNISVFYGVAGCIDNDNDGWGAAGSSLISCNNTASYDCNDSNANVHPNAYDHPNNGIDEDCSGEDATADYNSTIVFELDYNVGGFWGYHIGDDIGYEVNFLKDGALSNQDVSEIIVNLTDTNGDTIKSQSLSAMTYAGVGKWTGAFFTDDVGAQFDDKVQLKLFIYDIFGDILTQRTHQDEVFKSGTAPSLSSSLFSYFTDAISNYTVRDLVVNSSEAKIDWTGTKLDLTERIISLDSAITMDDKLIYMDSAAYSELNDSAALTFENVNCASPYIFYSETANTRAAIFAEKNQCLPPRCTDIQCSGSTLTVTVSSFSGYAAEGNANLSIDADDPKLDTELMHFTAEYWNSTAGGNFISGADCQIYFTDGNYPMVEGSNVYTYNRTFIGFGAGLQEYNVTCNHITWTPLTAFDNATTTSALIPEFSTITLGLGLIAVLAGLFIIRRKK